MPQTQLPLTRPSGAALEELLLAVQARASASAASASAVGPAQEDEAR